MPYNVLFDAVTRAAYGIDVRTNVVVVDEAHNFLSTVYESASFGISVQELEWAAAALAFYLRVTKSTKEAKLASADQIAKGVERIAQVLKAKNDSAQLSLIIKPNELRTKVCFFAR